MSRARILLAALAASTAALTAGGCSSTRQPTPVATITLDQAKHRLQDYVDAIVAEMPVKPRL
jgi:hypothetical protein